MGKRFEITIDGSVVLDIDQIWPDGDAPENPNANHVMLLLCKDGRWLDNLVDWNLDDEFAPAVHEVPVAKASP